MHADDEICLCFHVTQRKIVNFIRVERPQRVSQISECFGAGTGCGWCRPFLQRYFEVEQAELESALEMSPSEYAKGRSAYVRAGKGTPAPGATPIDPEGSDK